MLNIRTSALPGALYDTALKKRRVAGFAVIAVLLTLFVIFNRVPKLDTVQADLAAAASPTAECFQGFCIEREPESSLFSRWWEFSLTYLRLVAVGMIFAFLVAGATESFIFPRWSGQGLSGGGVTGSLKGLIVGPAMNLCSACIVPVASAFRRRGSGVETTLAIMQGSSTLNLPSLIMVSMVFVPMIGGTRVALSVVGALLLGPLVAKIARGGEPREPADGLAISPAIRVPERDAPWGETLLNACREWAVVTAGHVIRLAPAMILAGFASGLAIQWLSPDTVSDWLGDDLAGVAIAAAVGVAINVPLLFEIPLVAALLMAGMGSAPAAALLFTAASAGPITFWGLAKVMPKRAVAAFGAGVWLLGIAGGGAALWLISLGIAPDLALRSDYAADPRAEAAMRDAPYSPALSLGGGARAVASETSPAGGARETRFTDVTARAGIFHTHAPPQLLMDKTEPHYMVGGAAAEDFDGDGWVDLFVLRGGEAPSVLYMNMRDGTFRDEAAARGADLPTRYGGGAAAADYDNDGDVDIAVSAMRPPHYLLINDGAGNFSADSATLTEPRMFATSPSWGDLDGDGALELALGAWDPEAARAYYEATKSANDLPLALGDGAASSGANETSPSLFVYRADERGVLAPYEFREKPATDVWVFAPRFADLNGDGATDLAVVSDYGNSRLYLNAGGGKMRLADGASGALTDENGMGSAIGDYDNDGDLDWFVSSIFGADDPDRGVFGGTGNRLYRNDGGAGADGGLTLSDASASAGVRNGSWGWGASFGDLDNDGDLDIYHVNGWIQPASEGDPLEFHDQPARLFQNLGNGKFIETAAQSGADDGGQGRGVILFDYDNDGDLDIFITNAYEYAADGETRNPAAPVLLRNDTDNANNWLKVTLNGAPPHHRHGIGARVYATAGGATMMREIHASTNYAAQEPGRIAHFGLGDVDAVDEIRVEWRNGETTIINDADANRHIEIASDGTVRER